MSEQHTIDLERFRGYREPVLSLLQKYGIELWSVVSVHTVRGIFQGIVLPRSLTLDAQHLAIKLETGYNIGLRADLVLSIDNHGQKKAVYQETPQRVSLESKNPCVKLLGTGGTIAARVDFKTGEAIPAFSPEALYAFIPELSELAVLKTEKLFGVFSENMGKEHYLILAQKIEETVKEGVHGIVIAHGTDTLHYTAAALTYMVQNLPIPVVIVGSQRSSDRPSSDAARNLIAAVTAASQGDIAEVQVCMLGPSSDRYNLLHRGTRVRKMHSSYRSTFRTIGDIPLGMVEGSKIRVLKNNVQKRDPSRVPVVRACFDEHVTILYYYPNMLPDVVDAVVNAGYRGIIFVGAGLGHVNRKIYPALERAHKAGVQMFMTLQTLWGFVQMNVYETGREIQSFGVVPLANMLPEVAYIKLAWARGLYGDDAERVRELMTTPINDDMTEREPHEGYLVFQGGVPEYEDIIGKIQY